MPKRTDISSILIIGAGPIVIGQACEFDYSGTQACKALKEEGFKVILANSNPATIMTDPNLADVTYIEPLTIETLTNIIETEQPSAILPTMGGQTALNLALELDQSGTLKKNNIELIGANRLAIETAEDREKFRSAMTEIGINSPKSKIARSIEEAIEALEFVGLPAVIRPAFTMGGSGGGVAYNREDFFTICEKGLNVSPVSQILIDESLIGWKEYEMEVIRDKSDNSIIVCSIENVDPMGVHTGDSITVAPALTLTDKEYQLMRTKSIEVLRKIGVETGGSNVQWAINPKDGRMLIIEMNPRVSRSSALASKATGFPIAKIAAKLAVGFSLDELQNDITKVTPASFEPSIDYVVTKIPRFAFEKFLGSEIQLTTSMKSVGEVMAIGRSIHESLQKALSSLDTGLTGFDQTFDEKSSDLSVLSELSRKTPDRILHIAHALRKGFSTKKIRKLSDYDPWFIDRINEIIECERALEKDGMPSTAEELQLLKSMGFTDKKIAHLTKSTETLVRDTRAKFSVFPVFKRIDTCAGEFEAKTPYMYSTYEPIFELEKECESRPSSKEKFIILGGGPNRIGQGIEFDYCCCHACYSLSTAGYETIMINCNPETVSTDYDTADRLYFEPLTLESVLEIIRVESTNGTVKGVIVQLGGQTPLNLARELEKNDVRILGTSTDSIDYAEDRDRFQALVKKLGMKQPKNSVARSRKEALEIATNLGFPVVVRPSYVLGGRAMEIINDNGHLERYVNGPVEISVDDPLLIDTYLTDAIEIDVDAISDGSTVFVAGIMEHIEEAGVHSGDSACSLPPHSINSKLICKIEEETKRLALALKVIGLMNVQFAVKDNSVFVLEVNPRASRTVPFVSKAIAIPLPRIAARVLAGEKLTSFNLKRKDSPYFAVKEAVLPFDRFPEVDTILGPEMRSTGEVMGIADSFEIAFLKAQLGAGVTLPKYGNVFISVKESDKNLRLNETVAIIQKMGFIIYATTGTAKFLRRNKLKAKLVKKVSEGNPNIVDLLKDNKIDLVFNTTEGTQSIKDSKEIRALAVRNKIPYFTTAAGCHATARAIRAQKENVQGIIRIQDLEKV